MPYAFKDRDTALKLRAMAEANAGTGAGKVTPADVPHGDSWIVLTPAGGIPAMTGSTPGAADCVSQIIKDGQLIPWLNDKGDPVTVTVYNLSSEVSVDGDSYIPAGWVSGHVVGLSASPGDLCKWICENCDQFAIPDGGCG